MAAHLLAHLGQLCPLGGNSREQIVNARPALAVDGVATGEHAGEGAFEFPVVDLGRARLVGVRRDQDYTRVRYPQPDAVEPPFHTAGFLPLTRPPYEQVEGPLAEKELVRDAVNVLAAEVPGVHRDPFGCVAAGMIELQLSQTDSVGRAAVCLENLFPLRRFHCHCLDKRRLPHVAFAHQKQLRLVKDGALCRQAA